MSLLSWNYWGLGNPQAALDLRRLMKEKKPKIVFLMETKLPACRMEVIKVKTGYGNIFVMDSNG
jgi:exonuclease III